MADSRRELILEYSHKPYYGPHHSVEDGIFEEIIARLGEADDLMEVAEWANKQVAHAQPAYYALHFVELSTAIGRAWEKDKRNLASR